MTNDRMVAELGEILAGRADRLMRTAEKLTDSHHAGQGLLQAALKWVVTGWSMFGGSPAFRLYGGPA